MKREAEAAALAAIPQDAVERAAHVLATNTQHDYRYCLTLARSMLYVSMLHSEAIAERAKSDGFRRIVDQQAEDDGLWFKAETAAEAYVQQELRKLHAAVEALSTSPSPTPQQDAVREVVEAARAYAAEPIFYANESKREVADRLRRALMRFDASHPIPESDGC